MDCLWYQAGLVEGTGIEAKSTKQSIYGMKK